MMSSENRAHFSASCSKLGAASAVESPMKNWRNISWPWLRIPLLMLVTLAGCSGTQRMLQYETRPSPWKIYYVRTHHLSVGTGYHYEVRFRGQRFAIPKELLRSPSDIDEFESVTEPETTAHAGDTITLVFSHGIQEKSGTLSYGGRRVVRAQALDETKVSLRGLDGRGAAVIELDTGRP